MDYSVLFFALSGDKFAKQLADPSEKLLKKARRKLARELKSDPEAFKSIESAAEAICRGEVPRRGAPGVLRRALYLGRRGRRTNRSGNIPIRHVPLSRSVRYLAVDPAGDSPVSPSHHPIPAAGIRFSAPLVHGGRRPARHNGPPAERRRTTGAQSVQRSRGIGGRRQPGSGGVLQCVVGWQFVRREEYLTETRRSCRSFRIVPPWENSEEERIKGAEAG